MNYEYVKNSRHNLKRRLLYSMGNQCAICGYNKCSSALEFHHLNPANKDFALSTNANIAFEKALKEVQKCILVCANCHREIHEGLIDSNDLISSYDANKAQEMLQEIEDIKTKKLHYCKKCGKIISSKAEYCRECFCQNQRVVERPSREELKNMIRTLPFTHIANHYNITDNSVRKWCDGYKLPRTKKEINSYSDEEWENI